MHTAMTQHKRLRRSNDRPAKKGLYVLYWMQAAQRAEYNHALEYSIQRADELKKPVVAVFGITDNYPQANLRHYHFMLEGLRETKDTLKKNGIKLVIKHRSPELAAVELAKRACNVVVDAGHMRIQRKWRQYAARQVECIMEEVETNLIVPVTEASDKENFSAATFRPRITAVLEDYLVKLPHTAPVRSSLKMDFDSFDISNIDSALAKLDIDRSVNAVAMPAGTTAAKKQLRIFIKNKLDDYPRLRNDPTKDAASNMSAYLHFGQISPLYIALQVLNSTSAGRDAYLEELIVRRELSHNFVSYNRNYDTFASLPSWAANTLVSHARDKRKYLYSLKEFEHTGTHDPYWNAAQKQMLITGKMHGYMRMYWGKKILEWSRSPQQAFRTALYLNNKYELDGRDPNGFASVAWCFGKHDRPWGSRDIFGKVRYMSAEGLNRKFDADKYVEKIALLENKAQI